MEQARNPAPPERASNAGCGRRGFLRRAGGMGAAVLAAPAVPGCSVVGRIGSHTLDFSSDFGVLNYAYSLEVMESDFYTRVMASPPADIRPDELRVLRDIHQHEMSHRRFFARALGPLKIDVPERDFSSVNFNSRESVLTTARMFEDTGTAAYNGAGKLLSLAEFLSIAGKIVSVEARHAAILRDLLSDDPRAFAGDDIVDEFGMERALDPPEVIDRVQRFFRERFRLTGLPGRMGDGERRRGDDGRRDGRAARRRWPSPRWRATRTRRAACPKRSWTC